MGRGNEGAEKGQGVGLEKCRNGVGNVARGGRSSWKK